MEKKNRCLDEIIMDDPDGRQTNACKESYKICTTPKTKKQKYQIQIPEGLGPKRQFQVMIGNRRHVLTCPSGKKSGDMVIFTIDVPLGGGRIDVGMSRKPRRKHKGGAYSQYASNVAHSAGYSAPNTFGSQPWATGPVSKLRYVNSYDNYNHYKK